MSFFVNAVQGEAFKWVVDYFQGRNIRIQSSNPPSSIIAEFGSWFTMYPGNAKGNVNAQLMKRDNGTYINLNFDFSSYYASGLSMGVILSVAAFVFFNLFLTNVLHTATIPAVLQFYAVALSFGCVLIMALGLGYDVSKTRRNFLEEFNMFIQSLASKKTSLN